MGKTTIPLESEVRDRLRRFGHAGQTYNEILTQVLDRIEASGFVADMRREIDDLDRTGGWIADDDIDWGE